MKIEPMVCGRGSRKRVGIVFGAALCCVAIATHAFDARGTYAMPLNESISALHDRGLADADRKVAIAAIARQAADAICELQCAAAASGDVGDEARRRLAHLLEELR